VTLHILLKSHKSFVAITKCR